MRLWKPGRPVFAAAQPAAPSPPGPHSRGRRHCRLSPSPRQISAALSELVFQAARRLVGVGGTAEPLYEGRICALEFELEFFRSNGAFAALRVDGTIVAWGNGGNGGDTTSVQDELFSVNHIFRHTIMEGYVNWNVTMSET